MDHDDSTENFGSSIIPVDEVHKNFDDSAEIFGSSTRPAYGMSYNIYILYATMCACQAQNHPQPLLGI